jgi:NADH-quinone oxidoreductase subunit L
MIFILIILVLFLPLINFVYLIFTQKLSTRFAGGLSTSILGLALISTILIFSQIWGKKEFLEQWVWFSLGSDFCFRIGIWLDNLSALLWVLVCFVSLLTHLFSLSYMQYDRNLSRYFAYLSLFTFSMLALVLVDNLLLLYIFWELVGLGSYLLIGFWTEKKSAVRAAKKAFLINRVGDVGFLIGLILIYVFFGTFQLREIAQLIEQARPQLSLDHFQLSIIGFCLFCGTIGKSAQFPLQIWLPDAMEGPTPVSALIHAATMVAAGVYLLARIFFMLTIDVMILVAFVGAITTFIGGFSALVQKDIKKVLAYSTISQLGYMVMGMGVGAYEASLFHLLTHAFFKAGLFLSAGAIIYSLHQLSEKIELNFDAQNMFLMGGLASVLPFTMLNFSICAAALAGLPFFSGFLSKDAILSGTWAWAELLGEGGSIIFYLVPILGFVSVFLTGLYMTRVILLVFWGKFRLAQVFYKAEDALSKIKEADILMQIPLIILSLGSLWFFFSLNPLWAEGGWLFHTLQTPGNYLIGQKIQHQLVELQHYFHAYTSILSIVLTLSGILVAYFVYRFNEFIWFKTDSKKQVWQQIAQSGFYLNDFYDAIVLKLGYQVAKFTAKFDKQVIDNLVVTIGRAPVVIAHITAWFDRTFIDGTVNLLAYVSIWLGGIFRTIQNGQVQRYFAVTILCLVFLIWWMVS